MKSKPWMFFLLLGVSSYGSSAVSQLAFLPHGGRMPQHTYFLSIRFACCSTHTHKQCQRKAAHNFCTVTVSQTNSSSHLYEISKLMALKFFTRKSNGGKELHPCVNGCYQQLKSMSCQQIASREYWQVTETICHKDASSLMLPLPL